MDLNLLRVFQTIFEERNLTLAGGRLCLSQPSISYALRRLRDIFHDPLFVRTRNGMQPTPVALELSQPIARALQSVQDALRYAESFDPATTNRMFRISMSDMGEVVYLPLITKILRAEAPSIRLKIESMPGSELKEAMRTSRLDFAIGNLAFLLPACQHAPLFRETYVCITTKRRGLPKQEKLTPEEFLAFSHARVTATDNSHLILEACCAKLGVERTIVIDVPHFSVLPQILRDTDLAATVPRFIARWFNRGGEFAIYDLPFVVPETRIALYWHLDFETDPGNRWLIKNIVKAIRGVTRTIPANTPIINEVDS